MANVASIVAYAAQEAIRKGDWDDYILMLQNAINYRISHLRLVGTVTEGSDDRFQVSRRLRANSEYGKESDEPPVCPS